MCESRDATEGRSDIYNQDSTSYSHHLIPIQCSACIAWDKSALRKLARGVIVGMPLIYELIHKRTR